MGFLTAALAWSKRRIEPDGRKVGFPRCRPSPSASKLAKPIVLSPSIATTGAKRPSGYQAYGEDGAVEGFEPQARADV
jgi:hypothetical protein